MRVILMHNPSAGSEDHTARDLIKKVRDAGHEVIADVSRRRDLTAALRKPCDLVAVAGGDGTVGKAADSLAGTGVPFTVLPLGTANNIAETLGCTGEADDLIPEWERYEIRGFDRGSIVQANETSGFIEAFGFGAFPRIIRSANDSEEPEDPEEKLERDLTIFQSVVEEIETARYTISADGSDLSGEYLLVEVMNIPTLGPNVPLTPPSVPGDGTFELVLASESERDALVALVAGLRKGRRPQASLPSSRAKHVVISCSDRRYHRDGTLSGTSKKGRRSHFEISVEPHALQILAPPGRWSER
ncbi:MAG TPA: diacylglycerol kinase family protein [Thermoanaerobaculia bacterium]